MTIIEIKSYMKENKITYKMLSEKSGIPLGTLKEIFRGRIKNPRIDTMKAIENALKIPEGDFPISFEEFSAEFDKNKRLQQIAALPPEKQKIVFDTIDALLKNLEK